MDYDWQDEQYDYAQQENYLNPDVEDVYVGEEEGVFEEEDEGGFFEEEEEEGFEEEEEGNIDFRPEFKHLGQISLGSGMLEGVSVGLQKALRTPEETAKIEIRGILSTAPYTRLTEPKKKSIVDLSEKVKNIQLLNMETFTLASLWITSKLPLNSETFTKFMKEYASTGVDSIDLVRYIRLLQ